MPCQMHGVRRGFKAKAKDHGQLVCGDPMLHIRSCCFSSRFVFFFKRFCTLLIVTHTTTHLGNVMRCNALYMLSCFISAMVDHAHVSTNVQMTFSYK